VLTDLQHNGSCDGDPPPITQGDKNVRDLELILIGPDAADAIPELAAALGDAEVVLTPRPLHDKADAGRKAVDPVSIAALVLSIPSAVLAALDVADRFAKRRRAKALIEAAEHLYIDRRTDVMVVTADGPIPLTALEPDALLALVSQEDQATKDRG
jgi:hypothetical protein